MKVYVVIVSMILSLLVSAYSSGKDDLILLPKEKNIIDFHAHVAGLGYGDSGCFINENMRKNFRFNFYLMAMGVTLKELEKQGDQILFSKVSRAVQDSQSVSHALILAMDGVIDNQGDLDREQTQVYVPNDYVYEQTNRYDNLLFAASINPYRADAITRLEKVSAQGALAIKWIPSIMYIDPADPKIIPFYKKMAELGMPLLTHTGMEKSFASAKDELADPHRLKLPLQQGVTVIAAHVATTGLSEGQDNFERILPMFSSYPNLYADISSLTQINKLAYMERVLKEPTLKGRLIYGTDWPLIFFPLVSHWYRLDLISIAEARAIGRIKNQWDRDVALKTAMGVDSETFHLAKKLFVKQALR